MRRRLARELVVQILYYLEMNEVAPSSAVDYTIDEIRENDEGAMLQPKDEIDAQHVMSMVSGTRKHTVQFDEMLAHYLKSWRFDRLSKVDTQILRLALYELLFAEDVPHAVVLNEAVELAKRFGTIDSGKFVNGVLGQVLHDLPQLKQHVSIQGGQAE
jgi:N utilization substance protein B